MGKLTFLDGSSPSVLDGPTLARAIDRALAPAFVSVKLARRGTGTTTFRLENRLPFTIARVALRAGSSSGAPTVERTGLGIAPARGATVTVEAPSVHIEHVELNGL
jgi:hypothetical protein